MYEEFDLFTFLVGLPLAIVVVRTGVTLNQ